MLLIKYSFIAFIVLSMISGFFESDNDSKLPKSTLGKVFYYLAFIAGLAFFAGVIAWAWTKFFSLKSLLIITGVVFGVMALPFLFVFSMFNTGGRSEKIIGRLNSFSANSDKVHIKKIPLEKDKEIKKYSYEDYYNIKLKEKNWYINNKNTVYVKGGSPFAEADFDITEDMIRAKQLLSDEQIQKNGYENTGPYAYLLTPAGVYEFENHNTVKNIHNWNNTTFSSIVFCLDINAQYFIMITDGDRSKSFEKSIWQVSKNDFSLRLIGKDAYRPSDIPPRLIQPAGITGKILITYVESLDWGFGGNCSRPKFSKLVLFNEEHKQGLELATFSFSAGTVMDIEYDAETNAFTISCDPSRPPAANKKNDLFPNIYSLKIV